MAKPKSSVPVPVREGVPEPEEVRQAIQRIHAENHGAISYDVADEANELLHLRVQTDPGIAAQQRDGWRGVVREWAVTPWDITDETTGEVVTLPSLVLISDKGELVRLTGWPSVSSWAGIVRAAGVEKLRAGVPVVVKRRPSGTAGRSYWMVQIDCNLSPKGGNDE